MCDVDAVALATAREGDGEKEDAADLEGTDELVAEAEVDGIDEAEG